MPFEFKERLISVKRICKVTKGRRCFSFNAIVVRGNGNGTVGYGFGKSKEVSDAIYKAGEDAKKKLVKIPRISMGTIPHEQEAKFGGVRIFLKPASPGTGILSSRSIRAVFELAGIPNILSKSKGSSNPCNMVKAALKALVKMRSASEISKVRGISIDKMYNG